MKRIVLKKRAGIIFIGIGILSVFLYFLRIVGISDAMPKVIGLFVIAFSSFGVIVLLKEKCHNQKEIMVIFIAYLVHIVVLLVDIYGKQYISILHSGADSEAFYRISEQYYYNNYTESLTKYPMVLNALYQVIGLNRLVVQYINVLFWLFSEVVMMNVCEILEIKGKYRFMAVSLLGLFPNYLSLTSILLRESIISFFIFFSFYYLLQWLKKGERMSIVKSFLIVIPAIILHSGSVAIWIAYGVIYAFYSPKKNKIEIDEKSLGTLLFGTSVLVFLYFNDTMKGLFLAYIPNLEGNLIAGINNRLLIAQKYSSNAGYLVDIQISGYLDLFLRTVQRMYYFFFSPMPFNWRGVQDMAAFLVDSSLYIVSSIIGVLSLIHDRKKPYIKAMLTVLFSVAGVFAWGVSNSGTAMRHRSKVLGIVIILLVYCLQEKRTGMKIG